MIISHLFPGFDILCMLSKLKLLTLHFLSFSSVVNFMFFQRQAFTTWRELLAFKTSFRISHIFPHRNICTFVFFQHYMSYKWGIFIVNCPIHNTKYIFYLNGNYICAKITKSQFLSQRRLIPRNTIATTATTLRTGTRKATTAPLSQVCIHAIGKVNTNYLSFKATCYTSIVWPYQWRGRPKNTMITNGEWYHVLPNYLDGKAK